MRGAGRAAHSRVGNKGNRCMLIRPGLLLLDMREKELQYETSGFYHNPHIQVCLGDTFKVKGVFRFPLGQLEAA